MSISVSVDDAFHYRIYPAADKGMITPELNVSFIRSLRAAKLTCKLKKINDYKSFF